MRGMLALLALMLLAVLVIGPYHTSTGYPRTAAADGHHPAVQTDTVPGGISEKSRAGLTLAVMLAISGVLALARHTGHR